MKGGKIKGADIDNVRERTDIVRLIGEFVTLKKSGNQYRGLCPFHKEKGPSFYVDPDKGVYHCFGCKAGGTAYDFVMKLEGLSFPEAVERLADRIGYQLSYTEGSGDEIKARLGRERLLKMNQLAAEYYHHMLLRNESGIAARNYLKTRGFEKEIVTEFQLGYAPASWEGLTGFLKGKGYTEDEMVTIGLSARRKQKTGVFDIFRDRVIFPIADRRGKVVAFGGRSLPDSGEDARTSGPKYLNSPETPVYRKRSTLYGYYQSRATMQESREAIVVEGYTDLLALWQAGLHSVVATLGTALTENHFALLGRHCDRVYLCFDADTAGVEAARRALEFFGLFHFEVFVITLPQGDDPASLVAGSGLESFMEFRQKAVPLLEYSVRRIIDGVDHSTSMGKQRAMAACLPVLKKVATPDFLPVRNELARLISGLLHLPEETVEVFLRRSLKKERPGMGQADGGRDDRQAMWEKVENEAMTVLMHDPSVLLEQMYLDSDYFIDGGNKKIVDMLKEFSINDENDIQAGFDTFIGSMLERLDGELRAKASGYLMTAVPEGGPERTRKVFETLQLNFFKREQQRIEFEIGRVNSKLEPRKYEALCNSLLDIQQLIREQYPYHQE